MPPIRRRPTNWWPPRGPLFMEEFRRQCSVVRDMGVRVVEIDDNKVAAIFEIYAATELAPG
jgi:hypothetical protein